MKTKIRIVLSMIILAAFVFAGCVGKSEIDKALEQMDKVIAKVEKNKGNMTQADWQALEREAEAPLAVLNKAAEEDKIGPIQKLKIVTISAKWATILIDAGFSEIEKQTGIDRKDFGKELEKAAEELKKTATDNVSE